MSELIQIRLMKVFIVLGISLLILGHYLLSYADLPATMGVSGIIISASCIAFGLIFSLPTKMYLTFLLMKREQANQQNNAIENEIEKNMTEKR
ncbi:hypothetical protein [Cognaticolwellia aestuarii]|uniref:hypothetical protein n=1 Tax=Cognaticolwellia aestuarii TaxID=329993 RepID=UPI0009879498|nr:hypothetical protein [Cognaticolwellia aestuarii]